MKYTSPYFPLFLLFVNAVFCILLLVVHALVARALRIQLWQETTTIYFYIALCVYWVVYAIMIKLEEGSRAYASWIETFSVLHILFKDALHWCIRKAKK